MTRVVDFGQAEKKEKIRDSKIDSIYDQLQASGYSEEEKTMLLHLLSKTTAEKTFLMDLVPYIEFKTNILVE